jgi:Subtilase family
MVKESFTRKKMRKKLTKKLTLLVWGICISGLITPALALETSVGENGIDAIRLQQSPYNLTGQKIAIGQVEVGRPGKFGFDKVVSWNPKLSLAGVFHQNTPSKANMDVDDHAAMVAMVMVGGDKKLRGVAPNAKLYASAVGDLKQGGQSEECLSSQYIAQRNGGDVRAINFSFGESLQRDTREQASLDGNALLTQCVDWSARFHDVLYVIAGNQGSGGIPIPTDHYNGITTAYTAKRQGKFTKIDFANLSALPVGIGRSLIRREINAGTRRAINLVAPGNKIVLLDLEGQKTEVSGTSFAAPHITASVALLQEYGDSVLRQPLQSENALPSSTNWSIDARRHEVMKVILLNSADKIQDSGDGLRLGMTRTIYSKNNRTWLDSDAYKNEKIPLDMEMGTGHLQTFRAYQQFSSGQWNWQAPVPFRGWNYGSISENTTQDYILEKPLQKDGFVSISLAWDRQVELNDTNQNKQFDMGENFSDRGLNNLNIYLISVDEKDTNQHTCASTSDVDSVEHIFCQIPKTGRYKIRVEYAQKVNEETQPYALAWWTVPEVN